MTREVRDRVQATLDRHELRAKKAFGQNFLVDQNVLDAIVDAVVGRDVPSVIEIGAGIGTLTEALVDRIQEVVAIEKDAHLIPVLEETFRETPEVRIVRGDATKLQFATLSKSPRPAVVGNLPYNVTTPLLFSLLEQRAEIGAATVMIQREVADRLLASPSTREYGSPTVLFAMFADVEHVRDVPPSAFIPQPKVFSSVIRFEWRDTPLVPLDDPKHFEGVVRAAFARRRKTLRNSLRSRFEADVIENAAARTGIDFGRRAETLTVVELAKVAGEIPVSANPLPMVEEDEA